VHRNPNGSQDRTKTAPGGVVTQTFLEEDFGRVDTLPDRTVVTLDLDEDPRFGTQAPVAKSLTITTPGGLSRQTTTTRTATYVDSEASPRDPANLQTLTEQVKVNNKTYTSDYDAATRTWVLTSPEGRTLTAVLNAEGEVETIQRPGVEPVTLVYDDEGRLEESRGSRNNGPEMYAKHRLPLAESSPLGRFEEPRERDQVGDGASIASATGSLRVLKDPSNPGRAKL
jgi:hypothetical protein